MFNINHWKCFSFTSSCSVNHLFYFGLSWHSQLHSHESQHCFAGSPISWYFPVIQYTWWQPLVPANHIPTVMLNAPIPCTSACPCICSYYISATKILREHQVHKLGCRPGFGLWAPGITEQWLCLSISITNLSDHC